VGGDLEGSPERKALAGPHFHCTFGRTTSPTDRVSSRRRTAACPSACGQKGILTNLRRNVFSRSAPMHPANPKMNITPPTTRKSQTGSKPPRSVMEEMLDRTPWGQRSKHNGAPGCRGSFSTWKDFYNCLFPLAKKNFRGNRIIRCDRYSRNTANQSVNQSINFKSHQKNLLSLQGLDGFVFLAKLNKAKK